MTQTPPPPPTPPPLSSSPEPEQVTGVQLMQGIGVQPTVGFWADAWRTVMRRRSAVAALVWVSIVAFFAVFSPVIASSHPIWMRTIDRTTAAQSAAAITSRFARVENASPDAVRSALDAELARHSPRLSAAEFLPSPAPTTYTKADIAAIAQQLADRKPLNALGGTASSSSPLWENLTSIDLVLLGWGLATIAFVLFSRNSSKGRRFWSAIGVMTAMVAVLAISGLVHARLDALVADQGRRELSALARKLPIPVPAFDAKAFMANGATGFVVPAAAGLLVLAAAFFLPFGSRRARTALTLVGVVGATIGVGARWEQPFGRVDYIQREVAGEIVATYTLVSWSPLKRDSAMDRQPPGVSRLRSDIEYLLADLPRSGPLTSEQINSVSDHLEDLRTAYPEEIAEMREQLRDVQPGVADRADVVTVLDASARHHYIMGTDAYGQDVLSQVLHSCRLSISIGLVSTGVALLIGVTMGALMGYFGGWVDLLLSRVVEIFMAVPVLFLLIVAVAVLPEALRTTYVMMAIIGCFTWTGMARFTRAEFLKLRNQDFVQAARSAGLPLRSILFRHMLPNGVAPVLGDSSFAIAAAISIEATLSYLGLGPVDSASWGKLLSSAVSSDAVFKWWLAVFPGLAIFLTVLSYNLIGEALRDAIDPRLKKARV